MCAWVPAPWRVRCGGRRISNSRLRTKRDDLYRREAGGSIRFSATNVGSTSTNSRASPWRRTWRSDWTPGSGKVAAQKNEQAGGLTTHKTTVKERTLVQAGSDENLPVTHDIAAKRRISNDPDSNHCNSDHHRARR